MAIYHLHVKVISRRAGSSAVASAAYRSASRLRDERIDRVQDFSSKRGVVHSEVLLPENAPEAWSDRERLWNDVEAFEVRKDANKNQIKDAVESLYHVKVTEVRTQVRKGKPRRSRFKMTTTSDFKRAIVVLDEASKIELF